MAIMIAAKKKVRPAPPTDGLVPTKVPVADCLPNTWNMNVMPAAQYAKLKAWVAKSKEDTGRLALPIVIRTHPTEPGKWQIIDGYHRWKAASELKWTDVDCWVYECSDKDAMLLTDSLNYLRGDPDGEKYAEYLKALSKTGATLDEISALTHHSSEELQEIIDSYDIKIEDVPIDPVEVDTEDPDDKAAKTDEWVKMEFVVSKDAAEVIEAELARVGSVLTGKNIRGRALEFAMVQSAQTPMEDILPVDADDRAKVVKKKLTMVGKKKVKHAAS